MDKIIPKNLIIQGQNSIKSSQIKKIRISNRDQGAITLNNIGQDKSVYLLNISNSTIVINGKINNIYLEKCKNTTVICDYIINTFDAFDCGNIFLISKYDISTILSEQVSCFSLTVSKQNLDNTQIITMATFEFIMFSTRLNDFIPVKFSMFSDRFQTTFLNNIPNYKRIIPTSPNSLTI